MGLPIMTNKIYVETRNQIDEVVWILNEEAMQKAGLEKRYHAIKNRF